jgi:predicted TIM-barrel fold metal-dependent hydrolase
VHVFGPAPRYPFARDRTYTPPDASIDDLLKLQKQLGFERVVIVQPSVYGTDNSCTLDALKQLGSRARGVTVIDEKSDLVEMRKLGVRGVRVNLQTAGLNDPRLIEEAAQRVAPLGWHVQVFTNLKLLKRIERLPVPLVVDHFGSPRDQEDADYLVSLLRTGDVYVKLSGPHRCKVDPGELTRRLVAAAPSAACGAATGRIRSAVRAIRARCSRSTPSTT